MRRIFLLLVVALALTGCSTTIKYSDVVPPATQKLERGQAIFIALPADGMFETKTYPGSGYQTATFLSKHLTPYAKSATIATTVDDTPTALAKAKESGATYAFIPVIVLWEPRVAAWSGRPTRAGIVIAIHDAQTGQHLMTERIDIQGRTMTFVSQHVDSLVDRGIQDLCPKLF